MKLRLSGALLMAALTLCGCWDKAELEERGFVVSLGIDAKEDGELLLTMELPDLAAIAGKSGGGEKTIREAGGKTLQAAIGSAGARESLYLFFGQTKVCVFGRRLLESPSLFPRVLDELRDIPDMSRKIIVLASDSEAKAVLGAKPDGEPLIGLFISNFYKNKENYSDATYRLDFEELTKELDAGEAVVLPMVSVSGEDVAVDGGAVVKDGEGCEFLSQAEMRGFLFAAGNAEGAVLSLPSDGGHISAKIAKARVKVDFFENGGILSAQIALTVRLESKDNANAEAFTQSIAREAQASAMLIGGEYGADCLKLKEKLRKADYALFLRHENEPTERLYGALTITAEAAN